MAVIRRRAWTTPDGESRVRWQVDYVDRAGKRRAKQFKRKADAEAWLIGASFEVSQGTHTPSSQSITIADAAELWMKRHWREDLETTMMGTSSMCDCISCHCAAA